jgi:hypothetical protein
MKLTADWKTTLARAWSVRWIIAAGLLSGAEVALPLVREAIEPLGLLPPGVFAILAALASAGAVVARVLAQPPAAPGQEPKP